MKKLSPLMALLCIVSVVSFMLGYYHRGNEVELEFGNEAWAIDSNNYISFPEPNISNPMDISLVGPGANEECLLKVIEPNVIECDCTLHKFIKVMYSSMTETNSNEVVLRFADVGIAPAYDDYVFFEP